MGTPTPTERWGAPGAVSTAFRGVSDGNCDPGSRSRAFPVEAPLDPVEDQPLQAHPVEGVDLLHPGRRSHVDLRQETADHVDSDEEEPVPAQTGRQDLDDPPVPGALSETALLFSDVRAQRDAILSGVGFGWLPRHLLQDELREERVRIVTFEEGFRVRRTPRIVHRRDAPPGPAATAFIQTLQDEIDKLVRGPRRRAR